MITESDKAYLAGLLDGEGCITATFRELNRKGPSHVTIP